MSAFCGIRKRGLLYLVYVLNFLLQVADKTYEDAYEYMLQYGYSTSVFYLHKCLVFKSRKASAYSESTYFNLV